MGETLSHTTRLPLDPCLLLIEALPYSSALRGSETPERGEGCAPHLQLKPSRDDVPAVGCERRQLLFF